MTRFGGTLGSHNAPTPLTVPLPPTVPAQPGKLVPGFCYEGTATWVGPYAAGQMPGYPFGDPNPILIAGYGEVFSGVSADLAAELASSDQEWWEFH